MDREKFYQKQMARSENAEHRRSEIQPLYLACRNAATNAAFNAAFTDLWRVLDRTYRPVVKSLTNASPFTIDDIMQEVAIDLSQKLRQERESADVSSNFAALADKITKRRCVDHWRRQGRINKRFTEIFRNEDQEDDNGRLSVDDFADKATPTSLAEDKDHLRLVNHLLVSYAEAVFTYPREPEKALAYCYARILYQLDHFFGSGAMNNKEKAHQATSATWAFRQMDHKTFDFLAADSQQTVRWHLVPSLCWCSEFRDQLEQPSDLVTPPRPLKELYYTDHFPESQIGRWAYTIHDYVKDRVATALKNDPEYLELACEYLDRGSKLYGLLEEGDNEK